MFIKHIMYIVGANCVRPLFSAAVFAAALAVFVLGCASTKKTNDPSVLGLRPVTVDGCNVSYSDIEIADEFERWLLLGLLDSLTPEKFILSAHDTVRCRWQMEECAPDDIDGDNIMEMAWNRTASDLAGEAFGVLKDELTAVAGSGREYRIAVDRIDAERFDGGKSYEKYFAGCPAQPSVYLGISLIVAGRVGECARHNVFAFVRVSDGYRLMGVYIRNNDGFAVAKYRSGSAEMFMAQGSLCFDRDKFDCALENIGKAIEMTHSKDAQKASDAYALRGEVYHAMGDTAKAVADFTSAVRLDPTNDHAYSLRAAVYMSLEKYEEAIEDLDNVIRMNPDEQSAYLYRSNAYMLLGEFEEAAGDAKIAIGYDSSSSDAYNSRANAYAEMGEYEKAMEDYNEALKIEMSKSPNRADVLYYNKSMIYAYTGDKQKADSLYSEAKKARQAISEYFPEGYNDYEEDIKQYDKYIAKYPENARLHYHRGVVYYRMGNTEKAAADFEIVLRIDPDHAQAKYYLDLMGIDENVE